MDAPVVVVGGGPVGAALGMMIPGALVIEQAEFPRDKPCGEGLLPPGVAILEGLGISLDSAGFPPVAGVTYRLPGGALARADFPGSGCGFGVRRLRLDAMLAERARVVAGVRATGVRELPDRIELTTTDGVITAGALVAADGINSSIAKMLGWWRGSSRPERLGLVGHLAEAAPATDIEIFLGGGVEVYTAPTGPNETLVAVLGPRELLRPGSDGLVERYRALVALSSPALAVAPLTSRPRGVGPFHIRPTTVAAGRIFLAGDAAGFLDPLTGDALTAGLQQARALAGLLATPEEAAAPYRAWVGAQRRRRQRMSRLALWLCEHSSFSRRAVRGTAAHPEALGSLLAVNQGSTSLRQVPWSHWAHLAGWGRA